MAAASPDRPGVLAPPPLIYLGGGLVGWGIQLLVPWRLLPHRAWGIGLVVVLWAVGVALWAVATMTSAHTPVDPNRAVAHLVSSGPFRWSRNPIYLSLSATLLGAGLIANSGWIVIMLIPVLAVMRQGVILREERYLTAKFGDQYQRYCARVRRWL